jgi:TonB family protein
VETRSAIEAHRACAAKNLDAILAAGAAGTIMERAIAAEKPCVLEREALRNAIERENHAAAAGDTYSKYKVAGFADASIRFTQDRLLRDLAIAQTKSRGPTSVLVGGTHCLAVQPRFPSSLAGDRTFSGASVAAQVEILPTGTVNAVVVTSTSGYRDLDAAVFEALMKMTCDAQPNATASLVAKQYFDFKLE